MRDIRPREYLDVTVTAPGSKSYSQRALVIASLAQGSSMLRNALRSEDTDHLIGALRSLGADIEDADDGLSIRGTAGVISNPPREIHLGNNGTAIRLLSAVAALGRGTFVLTGDRRLCERPVLPLLEALRSLGVDAGTQNGRGTPPVIIRADGLRGGHAVLRDMDSSQYVSAVLICSPLAREDSIIEIEGPVPSRPYIDMTMETMRIFGVDVAEDSPGRFLIRGGQRYAGRVHTVEGDVSSASYFFLAAALCNGAVRVENILPGTLQGDIRLLEVMERLGIRVTRDESAVTVTGGPLHEGDYSFDLGDMPDMAPTLAVLSAVRNGKTAIRNVSHLRVKESNRIAALVNELRRVGADARELDDGLVIEGGRPHGAEIETYNDHRIAMSFAVLGLAVPGVRITNPSCVAKSFPGFWDELDKWG